MEELRPDSTSVWTLAGSPRTKWLRMREFLKRSGVHCKRKKREREKQRERGSTTAEKECCAKKRPALCRIQQNQVHVFKMWTFWNCVCLVAQLCLTLWNPMGCGLPGYSGHEDSPDKNTGVGCHALLQWIFPTQGSNRSLTLQADSLPAELLGNV